MEPTCLLSTSNNATTDLSVVAGPSVVDAGSGDGGGEGPAWRAPLEAQTSGSVVRNSMILLPVENIDVGRKNATGSAGRLSSDPVMDLQVDTTVANSPSSLTNRVTGDVTENDRVEDESRPLVHEEDVCRTQLASMERAESTIKLNAGIDCAGQSSQIEPPVRQEVFARAGNMDNGEQVVVAEAECPDGGDMSTSMPGLAKDTACVVVRDEDNNLRPAETFMLTAGTEDPGQSMRTEGTIGPQDVPQVRQDIESNALPASMEDTPDCVASDNYAVTQDASPVVLAPPLSTDLAEPTALTIAEVNRTVDGAGPSQLAEGAAEQDDGVVTKLEIPSSRGGDMGNDGQLLHSMENVSVQSILSNKKHNGVVMMDGGGDVGRRTSLAEPVGSSRIEDRGRDTDNLDQEEGVFLPSFTFTGGKDGYIYRLGDRGLGFYVDGYVDKAIQKSCIPIHRPWNAGPGDMAVRRGPLGPTPKPFKKLNTSRKRKEDLHATEESDMRPFMARMVAQRNSRAFQSTLLNREHVLDEHILSLLEKFNDPTFFKKKHGYNVHGQMLGRDGKMIVKPPVEKTEEEKAKLSWYRKVYEDRLGKHLPSKRLGDSIEARREAYAYSRYFTAELTDRQKALNESLEHALKGVTKLEFVTEDYHYPGAYDTDGKVILEKGAPVSNELHRTEEQKERACSFRFKAIQRYRAAHEDIKNAISNKDKALQKLIKKTEPAILQEIADEAVESSGRALYKQKKRPEAIDHGPEAGNSGATTGTPTQSPEQLRDNFAESLKAQIKSKDKALMKEVAAFAEQEAEQLIVDFGQGVEIYPDSWRQDPANLNRMQRRRKELIAEIEADRRKVVCPWRPGGQHIARGPWQPFLPRDRGPPARSASETHASASRQDTEKMDGSGAQDNTRREAIRGSNAGESGTRLGPKTDRGPRRPHTAPTSRKREFMDRISARARRVLAAQSPGTPLHNAFSTYSSDPYPLGKSQRSSQGVAASLTGRALGDFSLPESPREQSWTVVGEGSKNAWAEIPGSLSSADHSIPRAMRHQKGGPRPHSATPEGPRRIIACKRRPSTACGLRHPSNENADSACGSNVTKVTEDNTRAPREASLEEVKISENRECDESRCIRVRGGAGVTVLCTRLCGPSDMVYNRAAWPSRPEGLTPARMPGRRARRAQNMTKDPAVALMTHPDEREHILGGGGGGGTGLVTGDEDQIGFENDPAEVGEGTPSATLDVLEKRLSASSWRRVKQRRKVFRGYSDRSRRERIWDPGSEFYADGASKHHGCTGGICGEGGVGREESMNSGGKERAVSEGGQPRRHRGRCVPTEAEGPVDMDWTKVDAKRLCDAAEDMKTQLEGKLFAVVANDEDGAQLDECFREARGILDTTGDLLGWPHVLRERFKEKFGGRCAIGNYVATVSRVSLLWTATCGVIEILSMMERRKELLEEFLQALPAGTTESSVLAVGAPGRRCPGSVELTGESRQDRVLVFEKRLEIAEYAIAVAESVKLWIAYVPWRVSPLWDGMNVISRLGAEEDALPWPPEPGPDIGMGLSAAPASVEATHCADEDTLGPMSEPGVGRGPAGSADRSVSGWDHEHGCSHAEYTESERKVEGVVLHDGVGLMVDTTDGTI